uniref:Reverse transcriptase zinc-binding domain-containing protein n=1 Tax=Chenopodium quinoa TaxID=63459 RepID=A0A803N5Y0_CHEQI
MCATQLRKWADSTFGDVKKKIGEKEKELEEWQLEEWKKQVPDATMLERCMEIVAELDELHRNEESFWHARARANELKDDDRDTSYFHHKASHRRLRNFIHRMEDESGVNLEALHTHLTVEDANIVKSIPLSCRNPTDLMCWWLSSNGLYTTKSAYWLGLMGHVSSLRFRLNGEREELWNRIWHIGGPPKLCQFLWRACTGSLATLGRLFVLHIYVMMTLVRYATRSKNLFVMRFGVGSSRAAVVTNAAVSCNGWNEEGKILAVAIHREGNVASVKLVEILAARRGVQLEASGL